MAKFKNELLRQAIADADALKETAIANAKLSLEEEFTPAIKSMLARRLRAESEELEEDTDELNEKLDSSDIGKGDNKKPSKEASASSHIAEDKKLDSSEIGKGENKKPSNVASKSSDIAENVEEEIEENVEEVEEGVEEVEEGYEAEDEEDLDEDFNIDEIIAELEADIAGLGEGDDEEEDEESEEGDEPEAPEGDEGDEADADGEETDDIPDMKAPEPKDALEKNPMETGMEEEFDSSIDLDELLREIEAEEARANEELQTMAAKNAQLKNELGEYRRAVEILQRRLNEVKLLNAKLLYTNQLFRKEGLTTEQKINIIETFDRATTEREVKLVYTTLAEALVPAVATKKIASRNKVVVEGIASRVTGGKSVDSKEDSKSVIVESDTAMRFKRLAGIIKN